MFETSARFSSLTTLNSREDSIATKDLKRTSVRVVVLNYNGAGLLRACLPSLVNSAEQSRHRLKVTVLDNQSTDDSARIVEDEFPSVEFVRAPENRVLCSYNQFISVMEEPIALLLNNDIRVDENFIDPLIEPFLDDPNVFMTSPKVMSFDGKTLEGTATKAGFKYGMFWSSARYPGYEREADIPSDTFSSGFGAVSREKFLELGGYDPIYLPGILEDADLSLRASRKGYKLRYIPQSVVYHMGQASFHREYGKQKTLELAYRNTFLFMWKNFRSPGFLLKHFFFLPLRFIYALIRGNKAFIRGFFAACKVKGAKS